MKHLDINQRKQFISLLIHHMMYSDDKYAHILGVLDRWETNSPAEGFDFSFEQPKENKKVGRNRKM